MFRALFVVAQNLIKTGIGAGKVLILMVIIGTALLSFYTTSVMFLDYEVPTTKMCTHSSSEDLVILIDYLVRFITNFNKLKQNFN